MSLRKLSKNWGAVLKISASTLKSLVLKTQVLLGNAPVPPPELLATAMGNQLAKSGKSLALPQMAPRILLRIANADEAREVSTKLSRKYSMLKVHTLFSTLYALFIRKDVWEV
jgi:hypothetical protein